MPLKPILRPGSTTALDLRTARDFVGVETITDTDRRGFNRAAEWTQDVEGWIDAEHDGDGVHDTVRIPRCVLFAGYLFGGNGGTVPPAERYQIVPESYLRGTYASEDPGLFSVAVVADGVIDITLGIAMPSADFGVLDLCEAESAFESATPRSYWSPVSVYGQAISSTKVRITRVAAPTTLDGLHGPIAFALVG